MQDSMTASDRRSPSFSPLSYLNSFRSSRYSQANRSSQYYDGAQADERLAKALGWFSIGLGVAQLLAPRAISRATGVDDHPMLMRAIGVREIASGVGILNENRPTEWLWSRVVGDAMDLALLGLAATTPGTERKRVAIATAAIAGVTALDVLSSVRHTQREMAGTSETAGELAVEKSIVVNRTTEECYRFWRNFENFPRFMKHIESVNLLSDKRSHWKARGPAGTTFEWDAEITEDVVGEALVWRSLPGSEVDNSGVVRFERAPGGRGTLVRVHLQYRPPGGAAGAMIAKLFGEEPAQQMDEDLRRFKWLIETGEIPTTVGQPSGHRGPITRLLFRRGAPG